ncbi:MAG: HPr family phosphocarrier protein [Bdellovibrionota bacterium]
MELKKKILNEEGLHARPAGVLAKVASGFQSKIEVLFNGRTINAKSSMSLMTLGLVKDSEFSVRADGPDAEQALLKIAETIDNKFQL